MKTGRLLWILLLLFIGIVIYLNKCKNKADSHGGQSGPKSAVPLSVSGVIITTQPLEDKIYSSGSVLANEEVTISNELAGKITGIFFKEGSKVKKGDLLVKLYDTDLRAQLKKLQLQKENAARNEARQKDLLAINGVSRQDYEEALNALNTLEADIELVNSNLSKTEIKAPFDGIIGLKDVSIGAFLPINTRIAVIQQYDPLKIEFSIPERFRSSVRNGNVIHFTTPESPESKNATIYAFEPKVDIQTRSITVRALYKNEDLQIVPGAFARVEVPLSRIEDAILIPTQSLIPEMRGDKVFIVSEGKAKKVPVEAGSRNDSTVHIVSGLQPGDTVIITGIMQMRPDMPLKVTVINSSTAGADKK